MMSSQTLNIIMLYVCIQTVKKFLQILLQGISLVCVLPRKINISSAEVAISCCRSVDRAAKVKHLNDAGWTKVEVLTNDLDKLL